MELASSRNVGTQPEPEVNDQQLYLMVNHPLGCVRSQRRKRLLIAARLRHTIATQQNLVRLKNSANVLVNDLTSDLRIGEIINGQQYRRPEKPFQSDIGD